MSSSHVQLVKWTFPAVALIVGLFWYKRRRIDRADPGGIAVSSHKDKSLVEDKSTKEVVSNLYDSGIQEMDESLPINCCTRREESARFPRKVSESLDIPIRKTASQSFFSSESSDINQEWYKDVEPVCHMTSELGSNPKTNNFEMIAKGTSVPSFVANNNRDNIADKITRIFENVAEEEQPQCQSEPSGRSTVVNECNREQDGQAVPGERSKDNMEIQGQIMCERDSANHSPVSGMLEGSLTDEARSEGSTDSGKGGSINEQRAINVIPTVYEFAIPQHLVGRLIGRYGSFLQAIRSKAEVDIIVNDHPDTIDLKICSIKGSTNAITIALDMIRRKFPEKRFPQVTLTNVSMPREIEEVAWITDLMQLSLVEGVNNDVIICHITKPNWLFLQLPTHPTYPFLRMLDADMTHSYNNTISPPVPEILTKGMIVVAKRCDMWVRVCIENPDPLGQRNIVRLVDHGGYWTFSNSQMRKIRSDYLNLPFQAIEVFLANVRSNEEIWSEEAYNIVAQICCETVGQAQIEGYIDSNVYTNLYFNIQKHGLISLADELVARGFAETVTLENIIPETSTFAS